MHSGDVALRVLIVFSVAAFVTLVASLYEIDRREKSSSDTVAANLTHIAQQVQVLRNQIRIVNTQLGANERQIQALGSHIHTVDLRLKELEDHLRGPR
jgi:peptidoglycan hydrolase CwlO-like protein